MQGRIGNGEFEARRWVAVASIVMAGAVLAAASSSSGAEVRAEVRGHAPTVTITKGPPSNTKKHNVTFKFKSNKPNTKFKCKVDGGDYNGCSSPRKVSAGKGTHKFSVYGTALGVPGPTDTRKWTVTGKSGAGPRHHQLENYVFDGGPGAPLNGLILSANGPAGCALQYCLVNEPTLEADGAVIGGGPYADCPHEYHYHGFLFEQPDQPSGCGWGTVTPLSTIGSGVVVQNASIAITLEETSLLSDKPKDARAQLGVAIERLDAALQNPSIDTASAATLSQAEALDVKADGQLQKAAALRGKQRAKKLKKARKLIEDALALKRQVWDALVYTA